MIAIMINDLINNVSLLDIQKRKTIDFLKNSWDESILANYVSNDRVISNDDQSHVTCGLQSVMILVHESFTQIDKYLHKTVIMIQSVSIQQFFVTKILILLDLIML